MGVQIAGHLLVFDQNANDNVPMRLAVNAAPLIRACSAAFDEAVADLSAVIDFGP
jgi:hypothetical protein